jgi:hypothetical protein
LVINTQAFVNHAEIFVATFIIGHSAFSQLFADRSYSTTLKLDYPTKQQPEDDQRI